MNMSEVARGYYDSMLRGEIPPHNWDRNVTKSEKRKIYDAYVKYYVSLVKDGKDLPQRWPCKALTESQKQKIYNARGFGSTERLNGFVGAKKFLLREEKKHEEDEYWARHGGYKTKCVMDAARIARRKRDEFRRNRSNLKSIRRGIASGNIYVGSGRDIPSYYSLRNYCRYCEHRRQLSSHRNPPTLSEMRPEIIAIAKFENELINSFEYIKRNRPENWVVEYTKDVGLFNAKDYVVKKLPRLYDSKFFTYYRDAFVGNTLEHAILLESEILRESDRNKLSDLIKSNRGTSSSSSRQLRALGFVA